MRVRRDLGPIPAVRRVVAAAVLMIASVAVPAIAPAAAATQEDEPRVLASPPRDAATAEVDQVAAREARAPAPTQVSPPAERAARAALPPQVAPAGRSAEPSAPLSSRGHSRPAPATPIAGRDRCDATEAKSDPACLHVIEARAAEFAAPGRPSLSPEQRLLIDQRVRETPAGIAGAAARVARNDIDPNSPDQQGISSVVLMPPVPPAAPSPGSPASPDAGLQGFNQPTLDILQGVVEGLMGVPLPGLPGGTR